MNTRECTRRTAWFLVTVAALFASAGYAEWSEAVNLAELNTGMAASEPSLSADQRTICFIRDDYLMEAWRQDASGAFTEERVVSELGSGGRSIPDSWISADGLRLYYAEIISLDGQMQRLIRFAERETTDDFWTAKKTFEEIHVNGIIDTSPTLTADELMMVWYSQRYVNDPELRTFIATRASTDEPFTGIRELPELSAQAARHPHLSADGLRIYFTGSNPETGAANILVASRLSLEEPFDEAAVLEGICGPDLRASRPWLSADERTIYFNSVRGEQRGIWCSHWLEAPVDPYTAAVGRLEEAIAGKRAALGVVLSTLEDDRVVLAALNALREAGTVDPVNIVQAKVRVFQSIQQQISARRSLERSIADLEEALVRLQADPRRNLQRDNGKIKDKPAGPKIIKAARGSR